MYTFEVSIIQTTRSRPWIYFWSWFFCRSLLTNIAANWTSCFTLAISRNLILYYETYKCSKVEIEIHRSWNGWLFWNVETFPCKKGSKKNEVNDIVFVVKPRCRRKHCLSSFASMWTTAGSVPLYCAVVHVLNILNIIAHIS